MASAAFAGALLCGSVAAGIEAFGRSNAAPPHAPRYGEAVNRVEQQVLRFTQDRDEAEAASAAVAASGEKRASGSATPRGTEPPGMKPGKGPSAAAAMKKGLGSLSHGEMMKVRAAAEKYNIDLKALESQRVPVSSVDRTSAEGSRLVPRQVMAPQSTNYRFQNRPELGGDVARDMSTQRGYAQNTAENAYHEAVNRRHHNEDAQMLNQDGLAQHMFDGETSHYASSGMVARPQHGAVREARRELEPATTVSDQYQATRPYVQYDGGQQRMEVGVATPHTQHDGPTQVARGPSKVVNPRMNPGANVAAPDTVATARVRAAAELYDRNYSEDQVARMITAPTQATTVARQDLFEQIRSEDDATRLVNSPNNMATIIANQKPSAMQNEPDNTYKFYTDSGHTEAAPRAGAQEFHVNQAESQEGYNVAQDAVGGMARPVAGSQEWHSNQAEYQETPAVTHAIDMDARPVVGASEHHASQMEQQQTGAPVVQTIDMGGPTRPVAASEHRMSQMEQQLAAMRALQSDAASAPVAFSGTSESHQKAQEAMLNSRVAQAADAGITTVAPSLPERHDVQELNGVQPGMGNDSYITQVASGGVKQRRGD